jgi:hypothetical protein
MKRLLVGRPYPSGAFIMEACKRLLRHIGLDDSINCDDFTWAQNTDEPISEYWHNFLKLEIPKNTILTAGNRVYSNAEWFLMAFISLYLNIIGAS